VRDTAVDDLAHAHAHALPANVPAEVIERLSRLAEQEHSSVNAVAVRELAEVSRRADDPGLLAVLPDTGITVDDMVDAVDAGRAER
jgi:hypothetical protein